MRGRAYYKNSPSEKFWKITLLEISQNSPIGEICSKVTIKIPERLHWCRSSVFILKFEQILDIMVFLLLILNK